MASEAPTTNVNELSPLNQLAQSVSSKLAQNLTLSRRSFSQKMLHASWRICSVSQFKVGDRVYITTAIHLGVQVINRFNMYSSTIVYFNNSCDPMARLHEIELEHVFNSPLYAELK